MIYIEHLRFSVLAAAFCRAERQYQLKFAYLMSSIKVNSQSMDFNKQRMVASIFAETKLFLVAIDSILFCSTSRISTHTTNVTSLICKLFSPFLLDWSEAQIYLLLSKILCNRAIEQLNGNYNGIQFHIIKEEKLGVYECASGDEWIMDMYRCVITLAHTYTMQTVPSSNAHCAPNGQTIDPNALFRLLCVCYYYYFTETLNASNCIEHEHAFAFGVGFSIFMFCAMHQQSTGARSHKCMQMHIAFLCDLCWTVWLIDEHN